MSLATTFSRAILGIEALEVRVETHLSNGLPGFAIVGLPETAVKESKERVRSAILNSGLEFPDRRITVNLAPADVPKTGGRYDLAIALSILRASGQINQPVLDDMEILGELALDGSVRGVTGALPALLAARARRRRVLMPAANASELMMLDSVEAGYTESLLQTVEHLIHDRALATPPDRSALPAGPDPALLLAELSQIRGQAFAKRALQIAAAGGHNLLMIGPPGSGKTLLAKSLIGLLPALAEEEAIELAAVHSVARHDRCRGHWRQRPLRAPHHSASAVALVGGGNRAQPGEISLAHRGVLFLDELPEFKPGVLDALREPLESREITVSRASYRVRFPANFQLLAAMNPCPCGYADDIQRPCRCTPERIRSYMGKLSGPLLDRIDLIVEVPALAPAELLEPSRDATDWVRVRERIAASRQRQLDRAGKLNSELGVAELNQYCPLTQPQRRLLAETMSKLGLSARTTHRVIKVARTIADYEDRPEPIRADLLEAISYRRTGVLRGRGG